MKFVCNVYPNMKVHTKAGTIEFTDGEVDVTDAGKIAALKEAGFECLEKAKEKTKPTQAV